MLIYSDKYRGWGKQKPKQWGPVSAVRSSILNNADSYGIDPETIKIYVPFWSGTKIPVNLMSGDTFDVVGANLEWDVDCNYVGVESYYELDDRGAADSDVYTVLNVQQIFNSVAYGGVSGDYIGRNNPTTHSGWWFGRYQPDGSNTLRFGTHSGNIKAVIDSNLAAKTGWHEKHNLALVQSSNTSASVWYNGAPVVSGNNGYNGSSSTPEIRFGATPLESGGNDDSVFNIWQSIIFSQALDDDTIALFNDAPYNLLQPVAPVYYSFAGTTPSGTPVSVFYDSKFTAINQYIFEYDQRVAISNELASGYDTLAKASNTRSSAADSATAIANTLVQSTDGLASLSTDLLYGYDTKAAVGTLQAITVDFDTITKVRNSQIVNSDTIGKVSNQQTDNYDSTTSISRTLLHEIDSLLAAHNSIVAPYDTKAAVGTQDTITVSFDLLASVRNSLTNSANLRGVVSNQRLFVSDAKAAASRLVSSSYDSKLRASTSISTSFDTAVAISGLATVIKTFDTKVTAATEVAVFVDTLLQAVGDCASILCQSDIDNIVNTLMDRIEASPALQQAIAEAVWGYKR